MDPFDFKKDMERRRALIKAHQQKTGVKEEKLMDEFLLNYTCPQCEQTGTFKRSDFVGYTDPLAYSALCEVCKTGIGFGFSSTPHWDILDDDSVVEVSGRKIEVHSVHPNYLYAKPIVVPEVPQEMTPEAIDLIREIQAAYKKRKQEQC